MTALPDRAALQPERTALAWQRTAITATVVMVPLIVVNARLGAWLVTILVALSTITAGAMVVRVRRWFSQLREEPGPFAPFHPMLQVAIVTCVAASGGLVTALVRVLS